MPHINQVYHATAFGLSATLKLYGNETGLSVHYPRATSLGKRIRTDAGNVRAVLANYIRQELGLPRGERNATPFTWIG